MAVKDSWASFKRFMRKMKATPPQGHGPYDEANSGWVDPKPYVDVRSNGVFERYNDGALWYYFKFPDNVKIEWTKNANEVMYNQHFFVDLINDLGDMLDNQTERARGDMRRRFHIQMTVDRQKRIESFEGITPAHRDYLNRMSSNYIKPVWSGYIGIECIPSNAFHEAYSMKAKVERWLEMMKDTGALNFHLFREDIQYLSNIMTEHGFKPLDFLTPSGREDFERLTAWHGQYDEHYGLPAQLEFVNVKQPVHGMSLITPRWGEITFHAVTPLNEMFMTDPTAEIAAWSKPLFRPGSDVVAINVRGEIRSPRVAENFLDSKRLIKSEKSEKTSGSRGVSLSDREQDASDLSHLDIARSAASQKHSLLDNVEITIASQVSRHNKNRLNMNLSNYNLTATPLINRQAEALNNTFPTYPNPVFPVKSGNRTRSPLSNSMYSGVLAMSGLFRHTKPAAPGGILLGLSDSGYEYNEIYTGIEGASRKSASPSLLVTGRSGAGKTQQMLQMLAQVVYDNRGAVYLNYKPVGSLEPFFTEAVNGVTINMSNKFLNDNPGMLDPIIFHDDRTQVANVLYSAILKASGLDTVKGPDVSNRLAVLRSELHDKANDLRNQCSYDIIFGNEDIGTKPISDKQVAETIKHRINAAPFWRAFISQDPSVTKSSELRDRFASGEPLLVEWDKTLQLPEQSDLEGGQGINDDQIDSLLSAQIVFQYAVELIGEQKTGGAVFADESWVLKASEETRKLVETAGRTWREANIMLVLGTQRLLDWLDPDGSDMSSHFSRFLIMAISQQDRRELEMFFRLTGLPSQGKKGERNARYIIEAGAMTEDDDDEGRSQNKMIPRAYYIDQIYDFEGGIICGPWPSRELNAGRTDKSGIEARKRPSGFQEPEDEQPDAESLLMRIAEENQAVEDISAEDINESHEEVGVQDE